MNVTRIEVLNIQNINWQFLTARQIIDYGQTGVEVPDIYLSWAKDFLNSVNADDETTYEMAHTQQPDEVAPEKMPVLETGETNSVENEKNPNTVEKTEQNDEIENLENDIQVFLSRSRAQRNDFDIEINKEESSFDKLNQLQQELKRLGVNAQMRMVSVQPNINPKNENIYTQINSSEMLMESINSYIPTNDRLIFAVNPETIEQEDVIEPIMPQNQPEIDSDTAKDDQAKQIEKDIEEPVDDGSNASLDEILKRKIRRGQIDLSAT